VTETLRQKQSRFARQVPRLLDYAYSLGYDVTIGEVARSNEQAEINALGASGREQVAQLLERAFPLLAKKIRDNGKAANGIRASLHTDRLAIDLQLYDRAGAWLQDAYAYQLLGDYWKGLGVDHRYGGDFGDTPHYSIEHEGRK
jgi:hypothetical protein